MTAQEWDGMRILTEGICKMLSAKELLAMKRAIEEDSPVLMRRVSVFPPPLHDHGHEEPVQYCCILSYSGYVQGIKRNGELRDYFWNLCNKIDALCGEGSYKHFTAWYDFSSPAAFKRDFCKAVEEALLDKSRFGG